MWIHRVTGDQLTSGWAAAIQRIYTESFPQSERASFTELSETIATGSRELWVAESDDEVVGFGVTVATPEAGGVVLEYLAVDESLRSKGAGGELFDAIVRDARARCRRTDGGLLFEVERVAPEAQAADQRLRRVAFYQRHGAEIVRCAPRFVAPNAIPGDPPVEMTLMWVGLGPDASTPSGLRLRTLVRNLLTVSYELAPGDEMVNINLEELTC